MLKTTDQIFLQTIIAWFAKIQEAIVQCSSYRSALFTRYMVRSPNDVKGIIDKAPGNSIIYVSREENNLFPFRSIVDSQSINEALDTFSDTEWRVAIPSYYPKELDYHETGNTTDELRNALERVRGREVWIGKDFTFPDDYRQTSDVQQLIIARKPTTIA